MARDTLTARIQLQAHTDTIRALRLALADQTTQTQLVSHLSETVNAYLAGLTSDNFELELALKVSAVPTSHRGPRLPTPKVEQHLLSWYDPYAEVTNVVGQVGSADWWAWLQQETANSFRYEAGTGSFTAIKEMRRGRPVWYAHRRRAGQLKRIYLGKSENLTVTKLIQTASKFNEGETMGTRSRR